MKLILNQTSLCSTMAACALLAATVARGDLLLDDHWSDGSRVETNRPTEAAIWVGRPADIEVKPGSLTTAMGAASQKIWTYFTDTAPVKLSPGQKLIVSLSFIPRGVLSESTSRSLRVGLFHDSTSPRVERDVNDDAGGSDGPWRDAKGYAVQLHVGGGEYSSTKPFDLGKRVNLKSESLLGTSGDYVKVSGGSPLTLKLDQEYTVVFEIQRLSETEVALNVRYEKGGEELSAWSASDDGNYLGSGEVYDQFDQLSIRISNNTTTADRIEFTNIRVELAPSPSVE
jgi:hypothetical protein